MSSRRALRTCEICSAEYQPTYGDQRTCGRACGVELQWRQRLARRLATPLPPGIRRNCGECGTPFLTTSGSRKLCSGECSRRRQINRALDRHYGYTRAGMTEPSLIAYLIKRDHGRCGICRKPVRARSGRRGPSIDHIIPRSLGGGEELVNLQLAHLGCNSRKSNRGSGEQFLLIG